MSNRLGRAATLIADFLLVGCAVTLTAVVVKHTLFGQAAPKARFISNWQALAEAGHRMGPAAAPVQIIELSDFQCPACGHEFQTLKELRTKHPKDVAVIYRHFPLENLHRSAFAAAIAAECAGEDGRFESYHDVLFSEQDSIGIKSWHAFAVSAGVSDLAQFDQCIESRQTAKAVEADAQVGRQIGIRGTPTLIINGKLITGGLPLSDLENEVQEALQR